MRGTAMEWGKLYQLQTAIACSFGSLVMGLLNVWPSYTASLFTSNSTTPLSATMSTAQESLLGSLPSLGAMAGTAVAGPILNKFGRRNGGVIISLPYVLSWAIIEISSSPIMVLGARFLGGIAGGAFLILAPIFISEVAEDSIRGALASSTIMCYCTGTMLSYILGWFLTYRTIIWANLVFSVFCTLLILLVTESPVFLLRDKREDDARAALAHYRGLPTSSVVLLEELSRMKQQVTPAVELLSVSSEPETKAEEAEKEKLNSDAEKEKLNEDVEPEQPSAMSPIKLLFMSPTSRRAFLMVFIVIGMQVFMGMVPVQVFAKTVFSKTDPTKSDLYTVVFALVLLSGSLVTTMIADKAGRRILIISSSALVALFMTILGYLLQSQIAPGWVTVVMIMVYCFSFMFGAGSVPYVLLAEVFIPEVQSLASMLIIEWVWFLNFFIIAVFPYMNSFLGTHGAFYSFAFAGITNAVVSYFIVPETKGLSNEQIQETLIRRKKY